MRTDVASCPPLSCGGTVFACTDGMDNDGDGRFDLDDPECVSVCDDDEHAFRFGGPVGIEDCHIDCAFDGNSGAGDDMCVTDLRCDSEAPGTLLGCEYQQPCPGWPEPLADGCKPFCEQYTIPGCDCFGCCTYETANGSVSLYIDGDSECRLDDVSTCQTCTSRIEECGNPCDACEICFGHSEVGDDCRTNTCDLDRSPCTSADDCECGEACILGCCIPPPPG